MGFTQLFLLATLILSLSFYSWFLWISVSVMCRVYVSSDSYLSVRIRTTIVAQELMHIVAHRMEKPADEMVLVAQTYSGGLLLINYYDYIMEY